MSKKEIDGITKIAVKGFKSIAEEREIDIRPLTILAGANSSGKSSIMQPFLMLKQTLEAPYDPGPLKIDGPNVQFTEVGQFLSKLVGEDRADRFQIGIESRDPEISRPLTTVFEKGENGIEIVKMRTGIKSAAEPPLFSVFLNLRPEMPLEEAKVQVDRYPMSKDINGVKRSRCFLGFESEDGNGFYDVTPTIGEHILNTIHLPGLRGNPERTYKLTSTGPRYPGTFEHYTASIIHEWQETKDERLKTLVRALHILGLTGNISTQKVGDVGIEVQVGRLPTWQSGRD